MSVPNMPSFFSNSSNVTIIGGEFNDIKGNLTMFDHSRHNTTVDSYNTYNNTIRDSYNNNSRTISEQPDWSSLKVV